MSEKHAECDTGAEVKEKDGEGASTRVCIVGAGPRGLAVLERICANAEGASVDVHLVDPSPPGSGKVWRTDQSRDLLMNTVASQVTMYTDQSVDMAGPVRNGPSLWHWARRMATEAGEGCEEWLRREARRLGPNSYASRAFYGGYLQWVFGEVVSHAPSGVRVLTRRAHVTGLDEHGRDRLQRATLSDGSVIDDLDAVILSQGHTPRALGDAEQRFADFARAHGLGYVPPASPADVDLSGIRAGEPVMVRGLGLCCFDYLALLTSGRGGRFTRGEDGRLSYRPSGAEPRLYGGSRRGVPHRARGENQKGPFTRHAPVVLTSAVIEDLRRSGTGIDFRRQVWPLVAKEVESVYYTTLLRGRAGGAQVRAFTAAYLPLAWGRPEEDAVLTGFGIAPSQRWDWERLMHPYGDRRFGSADAFRDWLVGHLGEDVAEASRGNVDSPTHAALDVLRDVRNEVRLLVEHGALTADSHRDHLDGWFTPMNAFLSIGPPAHRVEEMVALIEAGVLAVLGPGATVETDPGEGRFQAFSPFVPGSAVAVSTLIEARLPEPDVRRTTDPLLTRLAETGEISTFRIRDAAGGSYETPGLAVTARPYHVVDTSGVAHPRRFAFGVPTESVHWVTAAGIRPGVNSVTLTDADAIARAGLELGAGGHDGADDLRRDVPAPRTGAVTAGAR